MHCGELTMYRADILALDGVCLRLETASISVAVCETTTTEVLRESFVSRGEGTILALPLPLSDTLSSGGSLVRERTLGISQFEKTILSLTKTFGVVHVVRIAEIHFSTTTTTGTFGCLTLSVVQTEKTHITCHIVVSYLRGSSPPCVRLSSRSD